MSRVSNWLWYVYGHTYDGLLNFLPYQKLLSLIIQRIDNSKNGQILDLGCGTGNLEKAIISDERYITAVDCSASMLKIAQNKLIKSGSHRYKLVNQDILEFLMSEPNDKYDTIVSVNVIYALDNREKIWQELKRISKPETEFVIATSVKTGSFDIIREHLNSRPWWSLLRPKLIGVFIVDSLINLLGDKGHFSFPGVEVLQKELLEIDYEITDLYTCYGGVDIIFTAKPI